MNKREYKFMLRNEISKLNKRIDNRIFMGYPYESDAKRHKMLLAALAKINRRERFTKIRDAIFGGGRMLTRIGFTLF